MLSLNRHEHLRVIPDVLVLPTNPQKGYDPIENPLTNTTSFASWRHRLEVAT